VSFLRGWERSLTWASTAFPTASRWVQPGRIPEAAEGPGATLLSEALRALGQSTAAQSAPRSPSRRGWSRGRSSPPTWPASTRAAGRPTLNPANLLIAGSTPMRGARALRGQVSMQAQGTHASAAANGAAPGGAAGARGHRPGRGISASGGDRLPRLARRPSARGTGTARNRAASLLRRCAGTSQQTKNVAAVSYFAVARQVRETLPPLLSVSSNESDERPCSVVPWAHTRARWNQDIEGEPAAHGDRSSSDILAPAERIARTGSAARGVVRELRSAPGGRLSRGAAQARAAPDAAYEHFFYQAMKTTSWRRQDHRGGGRLAAADACSPTASS